MEELKGYWIVGYNKGKLKGVVVGEWGIWNGGYRRIAVTGNNKVKGFTKGMRDWGRVKDHWRREVTELRRQGINRKIIYEHTEIKNYGRSCKRESET